jgi:pimeloyl-ACP methyl ester carboxylesterase
MQAFLGAMRDRKVGEAEVERFRCLLGECSGGRSPRQAPQWPRWVTYRNSLRGLYTISDYNDDPGRLRTLTIPVLVVGGAQTVAFHRQINAALLRALPRAEALGLDAGHNSPVVAPEPFIQAWSRFEARARQ